MEVNALLPYYLQQSIFFETLMNYMVFNTLFSLALCEIFCDAGSCFCNNTKLEKLQIICKSYMLIMHNFSLYPSYLSEYLLFGMIYLCIGSLIINNNYYGKYAINFKLPICFISLSFLYLIHKWHILCTH